MATACIDKALQWSAIKSEDGIALHEYALFFRTCLNATKDTHYMAELDISTNIRTIISKLSLKLRDMWRSYICELSDRQNKRVV